MIKSSSHDTTLIIFSDVDGSEMLTAIVTKLILENMNIRILLILKSDASVIKEIKKLDVPMELWLRKDSTSWLKYIFKIFITIRQRHISQIYCSGQVATLLGITAGFLGRSKSRIYIRHHSNVHHSKNGLHWRNKRALVFDLIMNSLSTKIIAVSNLIRNVLIEAERVPPNKVITIYNGIVLREFQCDTPLLDRRVLFAEKSNFPKIGVISRITEGKGVEYSAMAFCQIAKKYPRAHLIIIGEPSDSFGKVADILSVLDPSMYEFRVREDRIADFYKEIDLFVHVPISPDFEAFGLVYIEAIASRVPSIFTISGILNELEEPEKYFSIVPYRNSAAITHAINDFIEGSGSLGRDVPEAWLNRFSLENTAAEYFEALK